MPDQIYLHDLPICSNIKKLPALSFIALEFIALETGKVAVSQDKNRLGSHVRCY